MSISLTDLTKGDVVSTTTIELNRADLVRYAGASGDFNPIHWSESTARGVDLPGVIAHGMLTMGTAVDIVSQWCGDPSRILDYQTRFTAMVPVADTTPDSNPADPFGDDAVPGARLEVKATVGAINEEQSTARIDLAVINPDAENARVLTKAQVLVRL
ncbi:MaoC/PaaZ C-terminal domain-containing protein [Citricoccus muralis]|uniref:MaoC/PaaZ C-terminal domain-containing protein n=1 Tax=Citricoccus muralis TaxID=169134 RepID=A0ABY8H454_9MICC|nr:MaoC/PaaZ C-terminal domain-containing protein [Citricoccus muralis]WFP15909.1 MaoC/PaaZ C-terminal domain-containing protein [Citricoccus muralis]